MLTHKDLETFSEALGFGKDQAAITQAMLNVACPASHVLLWIGNPPSIPEPYLSAIKGYLGDSVAAEETEEPESENAEELKESEAEEPGGPPPIPVTEPVNYSTDDSTSNEGEADDEGEGDDEAEDDGEDNQDSDPVTDEDSAEVIVVVTGA